MVICRFPHREDILWWLWSFLLRSFKNASRSKYKFYTSFIFLTNVIESTCLYIIEGHYQTQQNVSVNWLINVKLIDAFTKFTPAELFVHTIKYYKKQKRVCQWFVDYRKFDSSIMEKHELQTWNNLIKEPFDVVKTSIKLTEAGMVWVVFDVVTCTCIR